MTIQELMHDAFKFDEPKLAYSIYWAIQKGLAQPNESFKSFQQVALNQEEIDQLIKDNPLEMDSTKLFTAKVEEGLFHLVLASNEKDARGEIYKETGNVPGRIFDITKDMDSPLWDETTRKGTTIRKIKDSALRIPHYIGVYDKQEKTADQVEYEYFLKYDFDWSEYDLSKT